MHIVDGIENAQHTHTLLYSLRNYKTTTQVTCPQGKQKALPVPEKCTVIFPIAPSFFPSRESHYPDFCDNFSSVLLHVSQLK